MNALDLDGWQVKPMRGRTGNLTHPWVAVAPGCPTAGHPTRWCGCKVHRTKAAAEQYVLEQIGVTS